MRLQVTLSWCCQSASVQPISYWDQILGFRRPVPSDPCCCSASGDTNQNSLGAAALRRVLLWLHPGSPGAQHFARPPPALGNRQAPVGRAMLPCHPQSNFPYHEWSGILRTTHCCIASLQVVRLLVQPGDDRIMCLVDHHFSLSARKITNLDVTRKDYNNLFELVDNN